MKCVEEKDKTGEADAGVKRKRDEDDEGVSGAAAAETVEPSKEASKKVKAEDAAPPSELMLRVQKQLEFYFGDSNFRRDRFMKQKAEEGKGFITIQCLLTFKKLQAMTTDPAVVVAAARLSSLIQLSEDGSSIGRTVPLEKANDQESALRSIFVDGFGAGNAELTPDFVISFFARFGDVTFCRVRRGPAENSENRAINGSVIVEFSTAAAAARAVEERESIVYKSAPLEKVLPLPEWLKTLKDAKKKDGEAAEGGSASSGAGQGGRGEAAAADGHSADDSIAPGGYHRGRVLRISGVSESFHPVHLRTIVNKLLEDAAPAAAEAAAATAIEGAAADGAVANGSAAAANGAAADGGDAAAADGAVAIDDAASPAAEEAAAAAPEDGEAAAPARRFGPCEFVVSKGGGVMLCRMRTAADAAAIVSISGGRIKLGDAGAKGGSTPEAVEDGAKTETKSEAATAEKDAAMDDAPADAAEGATPGKAVTLAKAGVAVPAEGAVVTICA
ncbi:unnamed protein product, partial [Phaeothamnion confervicola]